MADVEQSILPRCRGYRSTTRRGLVYEGDEWCWVWFLLVSPGWVSVVTVSAPQYALRVAQYAAQHAPKLHIQNALLVLQILTENHSNHPLHQSHPRHADAIRPTSNIAL